MAAVINSAMLTSILNDVRPWMGQGKVAGYIPALGYQNRRWAALLRRRCERAVLYSVDFKSPQSGGGDEPLSG